MNKNIRGITIVLDGDTTKLSKAMQSVVSESVKLHKELKEVERALKFDPGNAELLSQKQEILTKNIELTTQRLKKLNDVQAQVEAQFKRGDISAEQYRGFRREVVLTESSLKDLKRKLAEIDGGSSLDKLKQQFSSIEKSADDAKKSVTELGGELKDLAVGAVAGAGVAGVVQSALDLSELDTKIDISFDINDDSKKVVKESLREIEAYGVQGEEALEGLRRQWALNKDASDEANASIAKGAAAITKAFDGIDFKELIQETNEIGSAIGVSNEEALALTNTLLKAGFPPDQLDTISEYGQQMRDAGFSAKEIQSIFEAGIDTKTWNIDNLNDGVKEARIRMAEMSQGLSKAMVENLLPSVGMASEKFIEWGQAVAEGGEQGSKAMSEMVTWLDGIEDKALKNAIAVEIFGIKWEDQGQNLISVFKSVGDATDKSKSNIDGLADTVNKIDETPAVQFRQAISDLKTALEPVLAVLAKIIGIIASWVSENSKLASIIITIAAIGAAITPLTVGFKALLGPILAITKGIGKFGNAVKSMSINAGNNIKNLSNSFSNVSNKVKNAGTSVKGLDGDFKKLNTTLKNVKTSSSGANQSINTLNNNTSRLSTSKNKLNTTMKNTNQTLGSLSSNFTKAGNSASNASTKAGKVSGIFGKMSPLLGKVGKLLPTIARGFLGFTNPVGIAVNAISFLIDKFDLFKKIDLKKIGKWIIDGFLKGLKSAWNNVVSWIKNKAKEVGDWFKKILGIRSPSRVFMKFGQYTMEGYKIGLDKMSSTVNKDVANTAYSVTQSFKNALGKSRLKDAIPRLSVDTIQKTTFEYRNSMQNNTQQSTYTNGLLESLLDKMSKINSGDGNHTATINLYLDGDIIGKANVDYINRRSKIEGRSVLKNLTF
ncbi:MAG TPA: hypothetical protein H9667_11860 [Firmicutes bacterium]|nr:hypothetical protein [Bacillota bacterium]